MDKFSDTKIAIELIAKGGVPAQDEAAWNQLRETLAADCRLVGVSWDGKLHTPDERK